MYAEKRISLAVAACEAKFEIATFFVETFIFIKNCGVLPTYLFVTVVSGYLLVNVLMPMATHCDERVYVRDVNRSRVVT